MRRLLPWISLVAAAACGGDEGGRRDLGRPADAAELVHALRGVAGAEPAAIASRLAGAVLTQCGDECACLVKINGETACPAANDGVPAQWPPLELIGRYLAQQVARAHGETYAELLAVILPLRVPIARVDATRWTLPTAQRHRPLSPAPALIGLAPGRPPAVSRMPVVRFDDRGARVDDEAPLPAGSYPAAVAWACGAAAPPDVVLPGRSAQMIVGEVGGPLAGRRPIVAADVAADAFAVVEALQLQGGTIAVRAGAQVHELPIAFHDRVDPGDAPSIGLSFTPSMLLVSTSDPDLGRDGPVAAFGLDGGRFDPDPVLEVMHRYASSPNPDVAIAIADGTAADLVRLLDVALAAGAGTVRVTALPPPAATAPPVRFPRQFHQPIVRLGPLAAAGDLDRAIIRRYVHRNVVKLQYCYERELVSQPLLAGTLIAHFTIGPDGAVTRVQAAGVDPAVASCVEAAIRGIAFPPPRGGSVLVDYPVTFRTGP